MGGGAWGNPGLKPAVFQFKVLHRTHHTKSRLARIYPEVDQNCDRCYVALAT